MISSIESEEGFLSYVWWGSISLTNPG